MPRNAKKGPEKGPPPRRNSTATAARPPSESDGDDDEVDAFHRRRHSLAGAPNGRRGKYPDDDDDDDDDDEAVVDSASSEGEEVMAVREADDSDGDDDESDLDEDDDYEEAQRKLEDFRRSHAKMLRAKQAEDEELLTEPNKDATKAWGKRKGSFYNTDLAEGSESADEKMAEEEEAEALNIQKERVKALREEDFGLGGGVKLLSAAASKAAVAQTKKAIGKAAAGLQALHLVPDEGADVETLTATADLETRLRVLREEAPELEGLLGDLKDSLDAVSSNVRPVLDLLKKGNLATTHGMGYLEAKLHLLLTYSMYITFYLLMKAQRRSVKDHPVIGELVRVQTALEKLRPLDHKLKYQIDKLMRLAAVGHTQASGEEDPLQFRPNVAQMQSKIDEDIGSGDSDGDGSRTSGAVYRPPMVSAVSLDGDDADDRRASKEEKKRRRLAKSKMLVGLSRELSMAPEELPLGGEVLQDLDEEEKERIRFEEDNYRRTAPVKKAKKTKERPSYRDGFDDFEDFGDLESLSRMVGSGVDNGSDDYLASKRAAAKSKRGHVTGSDSEDGGRAAQTKKRRAPATAVQDNPLYDGVLAARERKEASEKAARAREKVDTNVVGEDGKREVGRDILKNRGLKAYRKKEARNPRVMNREKARKAEIRRAGQVRRPIDKSKPYAGERTGIKTNVTHSIPLS